MKDIDEKTVVLSHSYHGSVLTMPPPINYETMSLNQLSDCRKNIHIDKIRMNDGEHTVLAYLIRLTDILLMRVEELEDKLLMIDIMESGDDQ